MIEIISKANTIHVKLNGYYPEHVDSKEITWRKESVTLKNRGSFIEVEVIGELEHDVSFDGYQSEEFRIKTLQILEVDAVKPTDNDHLFELLSEAIN